MFRLVVTYLEPSQTSKMELFMKVVDRWKLWAGSQSCALDKLNNPPKLRCMDTSPILAGSLESLVQLRKVRCVRSVRIRNYSGLHFPAFTVNTDRCRVSLRIQSECGKMQTRITQNTDNFHAVVVTLRFSLAIFSWVCFICSFFLFSLVVYSTF